MTTTVENVRLAVSSMLDEGIPAPAILGILSGITEGGARERLVIVIGDETKQWLDSAETTMLRYAEEGSWTRLGHLLAKYQAITKASA